MTLSMLARDDELVEAARGGDDRAFETLYARYRPQIRGFAQRLTHDHDRAEDVTQEVFLSALRRLRATDRPIDFRPWIYEIARNACIDEHRRSQRTREVPIERDGEALSFEPLFASSPPPEVAVESKQLLADLRGAFRGLSERHHRVIVLRELEGRSYSEIGDQLGMSKMVVESTLFRARRRLSEEYEDLSSGRRCEYVQRLVADGVSKPISTLGLRDRRALSRHLEHCRPCRREAFAAGWHDSATPRLAGKAALLLPIPLLRLPSRIMAKVTGFLRGAHQTAALPSASVALQYGQLGPGRAVATAATVLAAVVGGGLAGGVAGQSGPAPASAARIGSSTAGRALFAHSELGHATLSSASMTGLTAFGWTEYRRTGSVAAAGGAGGSGSGSGGASRGNAGSSAGPGPDAAGSSTAGSGSVPASGTTAGPGATTAAGAGSGPGLGSGSPGVPTGLGGGVTGTSSQTGSAPAGTVLPTGTGSAAAGTVTATGAPKSSPVSLTPPASPAGPPSPSAPTPPPAPAPPSIPAVGAGSATGSTSPAGSSPASGATGTAGGTLPGLPGGLG